MAATATLSAVLCGCTVGPDFSADKLNPGADQYRYTRTSGKQTVGGQLQAGAAQQLVSGKDIPSDWWQLFQSAQLDQLIRTALKNSPSLASAQAALRQAQQTYQAQSGATQFPNVSATLGAQRERASAVQTGVPGGVEMNLYNAAVNVSYNVDLFGANRRGLEAAAAAVDLQRYTLEATYLTLTSNVVTSAIRDAALRAQLQATNDIISAQQQQLDIIERQFQVGAIPKASLLAQRNLLAQTRAGLPALEKSIEQNRNLLAVLTGQMPGQADLPEFSLASLTLPAELPLSLPSALARQRPDIRVAESALHQASAQLGVATANQYPQLNLSAGYGFTSTSTGNLFNDKSGFWSIGAGLTAPIFDAGALKSRRNAAEAAYDQAAAQYRATVLNAFQNVADSLQALDYDARTLQQQAHVEAMTRETLELSSRQYQLGSISSLALLDAKRNHYNARIALVQAQAARYADSAALFQSLGGGWWNRAELADISRPASTTVAQ